MFISPAYGQALLGGLGDSAGNLMQFLPLVLIFVVFYFMLIRPQQQRAKQHKQMLSALRRGDRVVTAGGIIATVAKVVSDEEVLLDIAEGTRVRVVRSTLSSVLAKTEPVAAKDKDADRDGGKDKADAPLAGVDDAASGEADKDKRKGAQRRTAGAK
jgi:preprotein translocase subunit YajC